eukprot:NODE_2939_length_723_cov_242.366469_g2075_i0.p2 GENE.NODE_2939_length_723_cov_242.366469_g2075_i0~~NODE_2939_length_723_cov_242.366469_g2075_i0.p2  ORF type:complete len:190 (-),score=48.27 NODE_2939_length_723_cov_242.366469_g2075_i0:154-666(-)
MDQEARIAELAGQNRILQSQVGQIQDEYEKLQEILRRREKQHLEQAAASSAQLNALRTTVLQLQTSLHEEKTERQATEESLTDQVGMALAEASRSRLELERSRLQSMKEAEQAKQDMQTMRDSVFELQQALSAKERALQQAEAAARVPLYSNLLPEPVPPEPGPIATANF